MIATGSKASVPPIRGLASVPYLTNETLFELTQQPKRLMIIGGGPIGCEVAQAYAALGVSVVLFESAESILNKEDSELVVLLRAQLQKEGVELHENSKIANVIKTANDEIEITYQNTLQNLSSHKVAGSHLLIRTVEHPIFLI